MTPSTIEFLKSLVKNEIKQQKFQLDHCKDEAFWLKTKDKLDDAREAEQELNQIISTI